MDSDEVGEECVCIPDGSHIGHPDKWSEVRHGPQYQVHEEQRTNGAIDTAANHMRAGMVTPKVIRKTSRTNLKVGKGVRDRGVPLLRLGGFKCFVIAILSPFKSRL